MNTSTKINNVTCRNRHRQEHKVIIVAELIPSNHIVTQCSSCSEIEIPARHETYPNLDLFLEAYATHKVNMNGYKRGGELQ